MQIAFPIETEDGECRVAVTPESIGKIRKLGHEVLVQEGAGAAAGFDDAAYEAAGASLVKTAKSLWSRGDLIAKVLPPSAAELSRLGDDKTLISFFYPGQSEAALNTAGRLDHPHTCDKW